MITSLVVGFVMSVGAIFSPEGERTIAAVANLSDAVQGRTTATINFTVAHYMPGYKLGHMLLSVLRWRILHAGSDSVLTGRNDWLFVADELTLVPNADAMMAARAGTVSRIAAKLKAQGVELLLVVVPDKVRIEPEHLGFPVPAGERGRLAKWMHSLASHSIRAVDLSADFVAYPDREALWLHADSHWSQVGAALAAKSVAAHVTTKIDVSHVFRTVVDPGETSDAGDLLGVLVLADIPEHLWIKLRPANEHYHLEHTYEVTSGAGDLLSDAPGAEVALVGSSFSLTSNFHGYLQQYLSAPVLNVALGGGGFASSVRRYFSSESFAESRPALVIWEMPERSVTALMTDDDKLLAEWAGK